jgi:hypothetical protein
MTSADTGVARTPAEVGMDAIVELLQRVIRAGSLRPIDFGTHWIDNGPQMVLILRWGDETLNLGFQKKDLESWPRGDLVPETYRGRIQVATAWLMGLQETLPGPNTTP